MDKNIIAVYINTNRQGGYHMPIGFWYSKEGGTYPVVIFRRPKGIPQADYDNIIAEIKAIWERGTDKISGEK